jgi:hypothetical protein
MNARQRIASLLWWSIPSHDDEDAKTQAERLLDLHDAEVVARRDAQIIAWLAKKAAEYGTSNRENRAKAEAVGRMADKLSRGAVREPSERSMIPRPTWPEQHKLMAAELRSRPGEWNVVKATPSIATARNTAALIKSAGITAYSPAGAYEAAARTVDGAHRVYVRYVGEATS